MLSRRMFLTAAAMAPLARAANMSANLGSAPTGFNMRIAAAREAGKPFDTIAYSYSLGLGGAEVSGAQWANPHGMRIVVNVPLPRSAADVEKFDAALQNCKASGVSMIHAAMTQRRYEQFDTLAAFQENFRQCQRSVELAEPLVRKHKIKLAIENHKGWRALEQAAWMRRVSSEWVGVCLDFGNNLALCGTPDQTLEILAPFTIFCHLKDMAVESYDEGFLLSEVPLGEGLLNLPAMVKKLQARDANMLFCLETITRDPLKIPVFTDKYWVTFEDAASLLPGRDLARVLEVVAKNKPKHPLPRITGLSSDERVKLEETNNVKSIAYAREKLGF